MPPPMLKKDLSLESINFSIVENSFDITSKYFFPIRLEFKKYLVKIFENKYLPKNFLNLKKKGLISSILCKTINLAAPLGRLKEITSEY